MILFEYSQIILFLIFYDFFLLFINIYLLFIIVFITAGTADCPSKIKSHR